MSPAPTFSSVVLRDWSLIQTGKELAALVRCNRDGLPVSALDTCLDWQYLWRVKDPSIPAKVLCCVRCPNWIKTAGEINALIRAFGSKREVLALVTENPKEGEKKEE